MVRMRPLLKWTVPPFTSNPHWFLPVTICSSALPNHPILPSLLPLRGQSVPVAGKEEPRWRGKYLLKPAKHGRSIKWTCIKEKKPSGTRKRWYILRGVVGEIEMHTPAPSILARFECSAVVITFSFNLITMQEKPHSFTCYQEIHKAVARQLRTFKTFVECNHKSGCYGVIPANPVMPVRGESSTKIKPEWLKLYWCPIVRWKS